MHQNDTPEFLIAALGASAGGLEPLETFFKYMPADAGIAFVIVQHLAPDHPTALPQLLGRHTGMPVEQAEDNTPVIPNRVYVIPPNATLTIEKGTLRVAPPAEARGSRTPIDVFFSSLAEDRGEHAVCIMLSGTGTDGTLGLRAIKEYGGMAMAQTLDSAKYDAILRSAISTGLVDHVLPVEEMPAKLLDYAAHLVSANGDGALDGVRAQIAANMGKVHALLRRRAGHDFSQYKENTIARRLERRMKALQIETVEQYIQTLERQPEETDRLFNDLLIGVTQFFRNGEAFEALQAEVIPKLFEGKGAGDQVRVCVMGCATGEEAYSIAILLSEHASTLDNAPKIQIFATDIDEGSLATARKGRYPESIGEHVTPERLARFFEKQNGAWQVNRELREIVLFSSHSFIKDPPFSRLDLISCRNVMIYLGQDLQRRLIPLFHYALRPGGYLFLGPSESAASHRELFETVQKKDRIFQRKETLPRPAVIFPTAEAGRRKKSGERRLPEAEERELPKRLERIILQRYRPACIAVKENGDAVYFSGRLSRYLEQPTGSPDVNIVNMAREGLRLPLRTALHRAATERERVVQKQIAVQTNGGFSQVDLTVEPIPEFHAANLYMVVLEDAVSPVPQSPAATGADTTSEETIRHLEDELRSAQEHAQAMFEELESSNEELKSANEEYQSTNEELETSKEELESFNEELQTVNTEISRKSAELDHANSDLQNLLNSTEIATIFLDAELRIKSFTPAAGAVFRLIASDAGRPITDLAAQFTDAGLVSDIQETLRTLKGRERPLAGTGGRHYHLRVLPYRTVKNVIDGVVLTFADVTEAIQAALLVEDAKTYAENIVDTVRAPLLVLDAGLRVRSANAAFYDEFRATPAETLNIPLDNLGVGQWDIPELSRLLGEVISANKNVEDFEAERDFPAIGRKIMMLDARQIRHNRDGEPLILLAIEDITGRKRAEEEHRAGEARYRALFDSCPVAIYACEASGEIREFNSRAAELWGREPKRGDSDERFCGSYKMHRPDGSFMPHEQCPMAEVLAGTMPEARDMEVQIERPDGSWVSVIVNIRALKNERGEITGAINCFVDVTERKRADEELRRLNADLQQFSYAASHDLQEPLRMVMSYTQLLAREYKGRLDGNADLFIANAVDGAERMEALLRDLREYWSVNEQRAENIVPVDCNRVLGKALVYLEMPIRESGATLTHDSLPTVTAEELPLTLLFQNLISNAIKYRREDQPPLIHVSAARSAGTWTFSVTDNGIGINTEYLETIFAPFKRLHGREYPGTGLGLAMCAKIVERYRGRIWAESTLGRGAAFHFTLPAKGGDE
jgi:two-component system, chemotaxis family, CheB/CheR fusion protein